MQEHEWAELLTHLIRRLTDLGAIELVNEIIATVSSRIIEIDHEPSAFESSRARSEVKDLGKTTTRLPTAREAFVRAIEVLRIRLEMLPSVGARTAELLHTEPSRVIWRTDEQNYLIRPIQDNPSIEGIVLNAKIQQDIQLSLINIMRFIQASEDV